MDQELQRPYRPINNQDDLELTRHEILGHTRTSEKAAPIQIRQRRTGQLIAALFVEESIFHVDNGPLETSFRAVVDAIKLIPELFK